MKKLKCILILIFIICITSSCNNQVSLNQIFNTNLTEEEKDIINLIGVKSDIEIYSYEVDDTFNNISIWLEIYKDGELISDENKMTSQINSNIGKLAVIVDKTSNFEWKISHQDDNSLSSYVFNTENEFETNGLFAVGSGTLTDKVQIFNDNDIVLKTFLFEDGNSLSAYNNQYFTEHPEVIKEFDYVYLLKCKFLTND